MKFLGNIASGEFGRPEKNITPSEDLFLNSDDLLRFSKIHFSLKGTFDNHYWASIPFIFEQECRLGVGLTRYARKKNLKPLTLWHIGAAEGTLIRSLSEYEAGQVKGLACTGSEVNRVAFLAHGVPKSAYLHVGRYTDINNDLLNQYSADFLPGFDIIIEDTTFQMLGSDRLSQIRGIFSLLKKDGILILTEKFNGDEYLDWEQKKDDSFKSCFFSKQDIEGKKEYVLNDMNKNQVTLEEIRDVASIFFKHGVIFWNSGNFYSIALSNDNVNLEDFISSLPPSIMPVGFTRTRENITLL